MSNEDQPLVGKKYLIMLPVLLAFAVWNVFFNPECRKLLGLKQGKTVSISSWFKFKPGAKPTASRPLTKLSFSAEDLTTFTSSFTNEQISVVVITPPKIDKQEEESDADKGDGALEPPEPPKDVPWLVPLQGTFADSQGRWTAIISGQYCREGKQILSSSQNRCAYRILSVGRNSVWVQAYPRTASSPPPLPKITWPDVSSIVLAREGNRGRSYVPTAIKFINGVTAGKGDVLEYRTMKTRFTVKELWHSGVIFEAEKGDERALIGCMFISR